MPMISCSDIVSTSVTTSCVGLVDDALEPLVALHLQPTGATRRLDRDGQLVIMARRRAAGSVTRDATGRL